MPPPWCRGGEGDRCVLPPGGQGSGQWGERGGMSGCLLGFFREGGEREEVFPRSCRNAKAPSVGRSVGGGGAGINVVFLCGASSHGTSPPLLLACFCPLFGTNGRGRRGGEGNFPLPCTHAEKGVVCCRRKSKKLHRTAGRRRKRWHCWRRRTVPPPSPPPGTKLRKSLIVRFSPFLLFQPLLALSQKGRKGGGGRNERGKRWLLS